MKDHRIELTLLIRKRINHMLISMRFKTPRMDTRILKSIVTNKIKDDPIITSDLFKYQFDINSNGTYNYQYVVHGNHRSLEVSLLYYKLVQYDDKGNLKSLAFGTMHNELNESFIPKLSRFDTLAVKAYRIKYSVK